MSILKVYLNWANSVLSEAGKYVDGVSAIQGGRVLCDLIDILTTNTGLVESVQKSTPGNVIPQQWIEKALQHMRSHGVKYTFTVQDILDGDIKSLLDVLWLTILNYSLHNIDQNAYQRSVGIGKKYLMEWCEQQLDTQFDSRNTFAFNLCQGNWFSKLLQKFLGGSTSNDQDRVTALSDLLDTVEETLSISRDIISASDIIDGTVDEHTLMIYVALLRRRVGGDDRLRAFSRLKKPPGGMNMDTADVLKRSRSSSPAIRYKSASEDEDKYSSDSELFGVEETQKKQFGNHSTYKPISNGNTSYRSPIHSKGSSGFTSRKYGSAEELSDWVSSSSFVSNHSNRNGLNHSPNDDVPIFLNSDGENLLKETISQQVYEHMPLSETEEEKLERKRPEPVKNGRKSEKKGNGLEGTYGRTVTEESKLNGRKKIENGATDKKLGDAVKIKRPKDYFLQWEDTLDRLSQGPSSSSDLIQSSRSQSEFDLESASGRSRSSSRSRSRSHESQHILLDSIAHRSSLDRERGRTPESLYRGKSHSQPDSMKKYVEERSRRKNDDRTSDPSEQHSPVESDRVSSSQGSDSRSPDLNLASLSGTTISDLQSHPMFPNLKSLLSSLDPHELDILNKSGEPPDVLTLLDKIKKARMAVDNNMPKENFRSRRDQERKDHTDVKSVDTPDADTEGRTESLSASQQRQTDGVRTADISPAGRNLRELSASPSSRRTISQNDRRRSPLQSSPGRHPSYSPRTRSPRVETGSSLTESVNNEVQARTKERLSLHQEEASIGSNVGYGRLPRREAWERKKNRRDDIPIDASRIDSLAQARFIEVLCKEIEELKNRMDTMESSDEGGPTSPVARSPSRTERITPPVQPTGTKIEPLSQFSDIHEQNGHMVFESSRSRSLSPIYTRQRKSPDLPRRLPLGRSIGPPQLETRQEIQDYSRSRSLSPTLERQRDIENRLRTQVSPDRFGGSRDRLHSPVQDSAYRLRTQQSPSPSPVRSGQCYDRYGTSPSRTASFSPLQGHQRDDYTLVDSEIAQLESSGLPVDGDDQTRSISLGYSSPVRSVTQEIWGNKLNTIKGLEPERQDRWKNLIAMRELSDEDVIELKQALASCIVENDILQAKLRNAKADVSEKLFKTNDVLDDCRRHLAKSQAENMELRSNLEHERQKAETMESRLKSLEDGLFQARSESEQLKTELKETTDALNKALNEQQPVEDLKQITQHLRINLSAVQSQNESFRRDIDEMQYSQDKAQSTIKELRTCLEEVREERSQLFQEINALHASNQKSKVADIIKHYSEKGACDEMEREVSRGIKSQQSPSGTGHMSRSSSGAAHTRRSRIDDYISPRQETKDASSRAHRRSSTWDNELDSSPGKLNSSLNLSGTLGDTTSSRDTGYSTMSTEDMMQSPTVPSSFREIYPHRKAQYYRDKQREMINFDPRASPIPFVDYPDLQQYPTKLGYSEYDTEDSYRSTRKSSKDYGGLRDSLLHRQHRDSPHRDNSYTEDFDQYESSQNYSSVRDIVETIVESHPTVYQRPHKDPSDRLSQSLHEAHLQSHHVSKKSEDRLNLSHNAVYDKYQRRSESPSSKKGILKNGKSKHVNHFRERSCSPVLQRYGRSHSPPTRLSTSETTANSSSGQKRPIYGRSSSARRVPRNENLDVGSHSDLKCGYSRAKSWYQLQLKENDCGKDDKRDRIAEITAKLGQEPTVLSEAQRRYADHLIEKYTGQRIPVMDTY